MLRRILVSAAVAASLPFMSALADELPVVAPEKVGLSVERLQRLTAALQAEVDAGQIPGAVVAIARKGQVAYLQTFGWIDPVRKTPMAKQHLLDCVDDQDNGFGGGHDAARGGQTAAL